MEIKGKKVLITGANRGIGLSLTKELSKRGATVFAGMRNPNSYAEHLENVTPVKCDLSSKESTDTFLELFKEKKEIDILINNAGMLTGGLFEEQPLDDIYNMMNVNLLAPIHLTHQLLPHLIKKMESMIVMNTSVSAVFNLPCASTYSASKAGLLALSESLSQELESTSVRVLKLLTPGIKTRMFDEIPNLYGEHLQSVEKMSSITPEEYASRVCDCIEKNKEYFSPGGEVGIGLWLYRHFPSFFKKMTLKDFKRK